MCTSAPGSRFPGRSKSAAVAALTALVLLGLAACGSGKGDWKTNNISGAMPDLAFTLINGHGDAVHADAFHGHYIMMYFGYTHCPDVCPQTLATLVAALNRLGERAQQFRVLFVSVDPQRDSPAQVAKYASAFGPGIVGLTGTQEQLQAVTKRYRVAYRLGKPDADGNYPVYHSAGIFVFDPQGRARLLMNYKDGIDAIAHDLSELVGENGGSS